MSELEPQEGYTPRQGVTGGAGGVVRQSFAWGEVMRSPYGLFPLVLSGVMFILVVIQASIFGVAGPNIAQDVNLDIKTVGGLFSIIGVISLVTTIIVGYLSDRTRRTRLVAALGVFTGIMTAAQARAVDSNSFAVPDIGAGATVQLSLSPVLPLLADWYPVSVRGRVFAIVGTLGTVGRLAGVVVVGLLVSLFGWRTTCVVVGIPLVLVGLAFLLLKEPVRGYFDKKAMGMDEAAALRADPPQSFGEAWRTTWSVRTLRRLFVADIFLEIGIIPFALYFNFFLADQYGLDVRQRILVQLPTIVAGLVGGVLGGGLVDALGKRAPNGVLRFLGALTLIALVGVAGASLQPPLWLLTVFLSVFYLGISLSGPGLQVVYSQVVPASVRGQAQQVTGLAAAPAYIAVAVFGAILANYGFSPMFLLAIPFFVIGGVIMISAADFFEGDRRNALIASSATEEARKLQDEGDSKLLICRAVNVFYDGTQVLFGVDFDVREGEIVALLGTNGAGKSTLLRAISGTQEAADGAIIVDGRDITHMPPHEIAGRGVVHMPGGRGVFPGLSVEENLRLATWLADSADVPKLMEDAYELFPVLRERRGTVAGAMSGGEQQMLALAQAFMARPKLLMIDELSLGLSPAVVGELLEKVKEIHRRGTTVIVVEQSVNVALNLAHRAIFMEKGEVKFVGPTQDLLRRPDILRAVYVKGTGSLTTGGSTPAASRDRRETGPSSTTVLDVQGVTKRFGGITALDHVDLQLRENQILGIIGPNGSGKTTLFDIISGYQAPDEGRVFYLGQDVTTMNPDHRARLKLIRRFQDARLFPSLTVFESLLVALDQKMEVRNAAMSVLQLPASRKAERTARRRADRLIELLELGAYRDKFVKELSTGLRRIVDLAFVLATEPRVLLLDEPSSGMAQSESEALAPLLTRVRHDTGCSILIIEHDMPLISAVSDELVALVNGATLARGTAGEVLNDPQLIEAFLGGSESAIQRSGALV